MSFDPERVRKDFPILSTKVHGKPLVFLDSAASAQKPECVIQAVSDMYRASYANVERGVYDLSVRATAVVEGAREKVARFIGAPEAHEVIFVRGVSSYSNSTSSSSPRSSMGATRCTAPLSWQRTCQGPMFAWCSMCVISTSSPGPTCWRP